MTDGEKIRPGKEETEACQRAEPANTRKEGKRLFDFY